jgi:hypothetical protein
MLAITAVISAAGVVCSNKARESVRPDPRFERRDKPQRWQYEYSGEGAICKIEF